MRQHGRARVSEIKKIETQQWTNEGECGNMVPTKQEKIEMKTMTKQIALALGPLHSALKNCIFPRHCKRIQRKEKKFSP